MSGYQGHERRQGDGYATEVMKKLVDLSGKVNDLATAQAVANKTLEYVGDALHELKALHAENSKKNAQQDLEIQAASTAAISAKDGVKTHTEGHWRWFVAMLATPAAIVAVIFIIKHIAKGP